MLAPAGTHTISDFKILAHCNLKTQKLKKTSKNIDEV